MRYRFRGLRRSSGSAVEGHVHATCEEAAYNILADNGIVTEALTYDPEAPGFETDRADAPHLAQAVDSAVDASGKQVAFDELAQRYKGKHVWVLDRDKIRRRVMQVVDQAILQGQDESESSEQTRERIAHVIEDMFQDNRNISTDASTNSNAAMDVQLARLEGVVHEMEKTVRFLMQAIRSGGVSGGGRGRRTVITQRSHDPEQDKVLLEIFETNLKLQRGEDPSTEQAADGQASDKSEPAQAQSDKDLVSAGEST